MTLEYCKLYNHSQHKEQHKTIKSTLFLKPFCFFVIITCNINGVTIIKLASNTNSINFIMLLSYWALKPVFLHLSLSNLNTMV